ncbi:MAG: response regulator transcription factor [Opitutales bacterium]
MPHPSAKPVEKVLNVDDDEHVRVYLEHALKTLGIQEICHAKNGWEAIAEYFTQQPDLVLLDINMPELSGPEALREMRKMFPEVRAVMITSEATHKRVREAIRIGAKGFIRKDIATEQLLHMLANYIDPAKATPYAST